MKKVLVIIFSTVLICSCSIHNKQVDYSQNLECKTPKLIFKLKEDCEKSNEHLCIYHSWTWTQTWWVCDSANTIINSEDE